MATINLGTITFGLGANTAQLQAAIGVINQFKAATGQAAASATSLGNAMQGVVRAAQLATGPLSGIAYRLTVINQLFKEGALVAALGVAGIAGAAYAFIRLGEAAVGTETHLITIRNHLYALSGSLFQTRVDMQFVMDTADKFGLRFDQVATHFAQLDIAARGTRLQGEGIREVFQQILSVAGTLTLSQEQLGGVLNDVSRLLSLGVVQWRNLRELTRDMPNIFELISKSLGTNSVAALQNFLKLGTQASDVVLPKLIAAWAKSFGIDATKPVDNLVAAHARLYNAVLRFNNSLDVAVGFSDGFQRTLQNMTKILDFMTDHIQTVAKAAGIAAGALGALASIYIIQGLLSVAKAIAGIKDAVELLNILLAVSPLGWIRIIAAVGGAIGAYFYLDKAIEGNREKLVSGGIDVDEYVKHWDKAREGFSVNTKSMIEDAERQKTQVLANIEATADALRSAQKTFDDLAARKQRPTISGTLFDLPRATTEQLATAQKAVDAQTEKLSSLQLAYLKASQAVEQLNRVLGEQKKAEAGVPGIQPGENQAMIRLELAIKKIKDETSDLNEQRLILLRTSPYGPDTEKATEELNIVKKLQEAFKGLKEAGVPSAQTVTLMKQYEDALRGVMDLQRLNKEYVAGWQLLDETFQDLGKTGVSKFVDAINAGTLSLKTLQDVGLSVVSTLEKKFLELAVINPIINAIFGGGVTGAVLPVFSLGARGTPAGGLVGALHGGSGTFTPRTVSPFAFIGAPRLHEGLAPDEYPAILQQGETVSPKGRATTTNGGYHIEAHMHYESTPPSHADQMAQTMAMRRMLESMMDGRIARSQAPGGSIYRGRSA